MIMRFIVFILDASGMIKFWHYTSGKCLHTINEVRQTLASAYNPLGTTLLTAGADPQLHLYNVETKQKVRTMEPRYLYYYSIYRTTRSVAMIAILLTSDFAYIVCDN